MYSRSMNTGRVADEVRVPKNYSGNAFSFKEPPPVKEEEPIEEETYVEEKIEEVPTSTKEEKTENPTTGFSFEDLLLIALILILSQNNSSDDILILLALVLAYKK